ncbi:MAG: DUF1343 domain-containing protein [Myxococcota bacterium]
MKTGLDRILAEPSALRGRVGLIANPTTVDATLVHAADRFAAHPDIDLRLLFGPEHGIRSDAQYMEGVGDEKDDATGLPVVSLYGDTFESLSPKAEHLEQLDTLVFDIQDIGTRYYTYAATMALAMKATEGRSVKIVVLDRPNPLGGVAVEGSGIEAGLESFVGLYSVPQRHGMTVGELAHLYRDHFGIDCELEVIPCEGWSRAQLFDQTDLPWVMPSPNMPTVETALVYPGMCLLEGTSVSEGRGTTRPFELFGAPYVDGGALARALHAMELPGLRCRPCAFTPTFDKYTGELCRGVQLHVTDRDAFLPYRTGIAVLAAMKAFYPGEFSWRKEAYEFRDDVPAIDLLTGSAEIRLAIDDEKSLDEIMALNDFALDGFESARDKARLYR